MTEPTAGGPPKRGRRDPELAARLAAEVIADETAQGNDPEAPINEVTLSVIGETVFGKVTQTIDILEGGEDNRGWFTFGYAGPVGDRSIEDALDETVDICTAGVLRQAAAMAERIEAIRAERDARPITPRR